MRRFARNTQSGFSLVELLAVVLILAVLAAVAIPLYINTRKSSAARACKANIATIAAAESAFALRHGVYNGTPMADYNATDPTTGGLVGGPEGLAAPVTCPLHNAAYTVSANADGSLTITCPDADEHATVVPSPAPLPPTADYSRTMAPPASENIP